VVIAAAGWAPGIGPYALGLYAGIDAGGGGGGGAGGG
jgi:hypothetical protein